MNEQERQGPVVPEQIIQPSPKNTIQKSKTSLIVTIIIVIVLIAGGWYFFSQKKSSFTAIKESKDFTTFDDSDLKISYTITPTVSENSAPAFNALSGNLVTSEDVNTLTKYIASSTTANLPSITQANKIISKYPDLLKAFNENATKPYQCNLGKGESCSLNAARGMTYLAGVQALILFEQKKETDAQKTASNLISLGKNISANADTDITLIAGWAAQKTGYSISSIVNSKSKTSLFSEAEKSTLITQLRNEHKKVFRYSYTRTAEGIDYITSPGKEPTGQTIFPDDEEIIGQYRKAIAENPEAWNPTETKKYFYDSYKILISNIDLPCGANLPEGRVDINFNPEDQKTENYIGKTMYSTTFASLNTLSVKRCEVETAIQNL